MKAKELIDPKVIKIFDVKCKVIDLTVSVAEDVPCWYSYGQPFLKKLFNWFDGIRGHMQDYVLVIEEHTGTHFDAPAHTIPEPKYSDRFSYAGPAGKITVEQIPPTYMMGDAAVIDVRRLNDLDVGPGKSPIITVQHVKEWEREQGELKAGEVVLFYTSWTDMYYKKFPEGYKLERDCRLLKKTQGWPAPEKETIEYLLERGIKHIGVDTVSLGSIQDDDSPHWAWHSEGFVNVEKLCNLGLLPPRGAFYIFLPIKLEGGSGAPGRAIALIQAK